MLVTLPIILILLDFWPLGIYEIKGEQKVRQLYEKTISIIKEKIPFLIFSLLSCLITIYAQQKGGAVASFSVVPFRLRIENAMIAYITY